MPMISVLSSAVQGEPLFRNNRVDLSLPRGSQHAWEVHLQASIISDLIGDDGAPFTDADWDGFFADYAPDEIRNTPTLHEFTDQRASDLRTVRAAVTPQSRETSWPPPRSTTASNPATS